MLPPRAPLPRRARYGLAGRTVFVTGPSRGIGAETARQVAAKGANVALAGLEPDRLEELARDIGPPAAWFEADVRSAEQVDAAVAGTVERFGGIDVVVANAGVLVSGTVGEAREEEVELVVDVNLIGTWRTVHAALPHVLARDGYVLHVASLAAIVPQGRHAAYAASKAGVSSLADSLRMELAGTGTRVGCAYLGLVDTDMADWRRAGQADAGSRRRRRIPVTEAAEAIVAGIEARAPVIVLPPKARFAVSAPGPFRRITELRMRVRRARRPARRAASGTPAG